MLLLFNTLFGLQEQAVYGAYQGGNEYNDPVHQYVSSFGADTEALEAEPTNESASLVDPYAAYDPNVYNPSAPNAFQSGAYNPGAFHVRTGYEGYLVPGLPKQAVQQETVASREPQTFFSPLTAFTNNLPQTMRQAGSLLGRSFVFLLGLLGVTVFGGGITTAICTFTPLCTISFALPLVGIRSGVKEMAENYIGADSTKFVLQAIEKYSKMQPDEKASMAAQSEPIDTDIKSKAAVETEALMEKTEDSANK